MKRFVIGLQGLLLAAVGFYHWRLNSQVDQLENAYLHAEQESRRNPAEAANAWIRSPMLLQIQDFVKANGPTLDEENAARLREDPCFEKLVSRFYAQVRLRDVQSALRSRLVMSRATQADFLTADTEPAAGWLWKMALDATKGDHNLAFHVLGVCSLPTATLTWTEEDGLLKSERAKVMAEVHQLAREIAPSPKEADELEFVIKSHLEKPACPSAASKMYWPGSLQERAPAPATQNAPDQNREAHYGNVLHSAFSSCLLYQKGMPGPVIEELQERLRSLQRSERLCHLIQTALVQSETLKFDDFEWTSAAAHSLLQTLVKNPQICEGTSNFSPELQPLADRICPVMRNQVTSVHGPEELQRAMRQAFTDLDTAIFVREHPQWRLAPGCETAEGRKLLPGLLNSAMSLRCPRVWSPARCARVMQNLENWIRDDLYQADQVRQGLGFSRLNCVSLGPDVSALANSCKVTGN